MSLASQVSALATRIATEVKSKASLAAPIFLDSIEIHDDPESPTNQQRTIIRGGDVSMVVASDIAQAGGGVGSGRARGTIAAPTIVQDGDGVLYLAVPLAHDGTDYIQVGQMLFDVDGTPAADNIPTRFTATAMDDAGDLWDFLTVRATRDVFPDGIWRDMVLNAPFIDGAWDAFGGSMNYPTVAALRESVGVSGTGATGTIHLETLDRTSKVITANSTANFTINMRGNGTYTLDQTMATGDQVVFSLAVTNGTTAYRATAINIDGSGATVKWLGGVAPTAGTPSAMDIYTFVVTKTGSGAFLVWGSMGTVI